jgi:YD repeat-containing protein
MSSAVQATVQHVPFRATALADRGFYDQGSSVTIRGEALDPATGAVVPNIEVAVHAVSNGYDRAMSAVTDNAGKYSAGFFPLPNEAGVYTVSAAAPAVLTRAAQSTFTIVGFGFQYADFTATLAQNSTYAFTVGLTNTGASELTGLSASTEAVSAGGVTLTVASNTLPASLAAGARAWLGLSLSAEPLSSSGTINVILTEAHGFSRKMPIIVQVTPSQVIPEATPGRIEMGMLGGEVRTVPLVLRNKGFATWRDVTLNSPGLPWVTILGGTSLGDIAPGGNANVVLKFSPPASLANQTYSADPLLQITSLNSPAVGVAAAVSVTSTKKGDVLVSVVNADKPKSPTGQGVPIPGAKVTLVSQDVLGLTFSLTADLNGLAAFSQVPSGNYAWRAEAKGFQTRSATTVIEPGMTNRLEGILATAVVSYQWTVSPTAIMDRYDVTLSITYRTDVPAPVLVSDPPYANYKLNLGQSAYGQYTITNKGSVSVFDFKLKSTRDDGLAMEFPFTSIPEIKPGQSVVVPYKVTFVHASNYCKNFEVTGSGSFSCAYGTTQETSGGGQRGVAGNEGGSACGSGGEGGVGGSGATQGPSGSGSGVGTSVSGQGAGNLAEGGTTAPSCDVRGSDEPRYPSPPPDPPEMPPFSGGATNCGNSCGAPMASPALIISPMHRSLAGTSGPLGFGWSSDYFESVTVTTVASFGQGGRVYLYVVNDGQGTGMGFYLVAPPPGSGGQEVQTFTPAFTPPPGTHDRLIATPVTRMLVQGESEIAPPASLDYRRTDGTTIRFRLSSLTPGLFLPSLLTDRNGNTVTYYRDSSERLTRLTDVHGRTVDLTYDGNDRVVSVTDNAGRQVFYAYDSAGNKTSDTDVNGDLTQYVYDGNHRMTRITYPNGGGRRIPTMTQAGFWWSPTIPGTTS